MLKERRQIAETVAQQLFAAEAAIDAAIAATATLAATMPMARGEARIAACVGQDALMEAMATCTKLVEARERIVATHKALRVTQRQMGLDAVNFGGLVDKFLTVPGEDGGPSARRLSAVKSETDTLRAA